MNEVQPIRDFENIFKIIEYLKTNHFSIAVVFVLGIYSGLRVSDIINLNIVDVLDKDEIRVKEKKTKKIKIFPIKQQPKELLDEYLRVRFNEGVKKTSPLFIGVKGDRLHRSMVYKGINEACEHIGLVGLFGTHTMRKTFGYHHYKQNHDVVLLQKIFNHSSPSITLRYIGVEQDEINCSYEKFEYSSELQKSTNTTDFSEQFQQLNKRIDILIKLYLEICKRL